MSRTDILTQTVSLADDLHDGVVNERRSNLRRCYSSLALKNDTGYSQSLDLDIEIITAEESNLKIN